VVKIMLLDKPKETPVTVIVDANASCWKVKHALGELTHETMKVGIIFGFLGELYRFAEAYKTSSFAICWDSHKSHREKIFPAYKETRRTIKAEKTEEEREQDKLDYAQFDLLYDEVMPMLGVTNNYKIAGFEGDDLIASVVYANGDTDFIITTGDADMYQLLGDGVTIRKFKLDAKKRKIFYQYTEEMFTAQYGIKPRQWIEVKALAGCKSDEVPGIPSVGADTALKYLRNELPRNYKRYDAIVCPEGKAIRQRNLQLVSLPFKGCPELFLKKQGPLSLDGFLAICAKYEFQHYLKKDNLNQWKKVLNLK
jgi:5'-3' exonuclease